MTLTILRQPFQIQWTNRGTGLGEVVRSQPGGVEHARPRLVGQQLHLLQRQQRGTVHVVEQEQRRAARTQHVEHPPHGPGIVQLFLVGQLDFEFGHERAENGEQPVAAFAAQQPATAGKGIGFLVSEGLRERGLAHAADAVEASRGWLRRIEQRSAQAGELRFAPDEVCIRPGQIAPAGAIQREQAQALSDVLGDLKTGGSEGVMSQLREVTATLRPTLARLDAPARTVLQIASLLAPDGVALPWVRAIAGQTHPELAAKPPPVKATRGRN